MSNFEYTITVTMPDTSGMDTVTPDDDLGGFSLFYSGSDNTLSDYGVGVEFTLSSTAVGGDTNLGLIKFSGAGSYISSGTKTETNGANSLDFDVSLSGGVLTIVIRPVVSPYAITRLRTANVATLDFTWLAANTGGWASQSYVPVITITGGNSPVAVSNTNSWSVGGPYLTYARSWYLTDVGYGAPPPPPPPAPAPAAAENDEGGYLGPILRTDDGIFRVTAVAAGLMTLELYEAPKRVIRETRD